jgi:hypothetical protein
MKIVSKVPMLLLSLSMRAAQQTEVQWASSVNAFVEGGCSGSPVSMM